MKLKKKLLIFFSALIVVLLFIVFSFADEYTLEDIFTKQCMTNTTSEIFEYTPEGLVLRKTVDPETVFKREDEHNTLDGYQSVFTDEGIFYIEKSDLKSAEDFRRTCLENGYLWAHVNLDTSVFDDKDFTTNAYVKIFDENTQTFVPTQTPMVVQEGNVVSVVDIFDNSVKIILPSGDSGFIPYDYLTFEISKDENFGTFQMTDDIRMQIVKTALSYEGGRYKWGGTSLENGVDCSGFTMMIFQKYGFSLSHSASGQKSETVSINKEELLPGDLVFYNGYKGKNKIGHVGIYIGNNQIVHAQNKKVGITVSDINYDTPCGYGRVL